MAAFRRIQGVNGSSAGTFVSNVVITSGGMINSTLSSLESNVITENEPISFAEKESSERKRLSIVEKLPELTIVSSVISLYSEEKIKRIALVDIDNPDISDPRTPPPNSLYDSRMGTVVADRLCTTCKTANCLGHYGRIKFEAPIPHPMWLPVIRDILTCVCESCGRLLIRKKTIHYHGLHYLSIQRRISGIASLVNTKTRCTNSKKCPEIRNGIVEPCTTNPKYKAPKADEDYNIQTARLIDRSVISTIIKPEKILSIFKCITDKDAALMGFEDGARPENLILQSLVVIPPGARLPFIADGRNNPDNLTEQYRQIVICANELRLKPEDQRIRSNLYFKVKTLMEGRKQKYKTKSVFMSIANNLQGKQALPRSSLMGKRTNLCARTVISPDTSLRYNQIRVPSEWASILTIPEVVTKFNLSRLQEELKAGKITDIKPFNNGNYYIRRGVDVNTEIKVHDKVWRHLRDGDIVVINRQPTLHKFSMLAFEVKLSPERTIGLHLSYTTTFNADFDGDEMNIWVPQSVEAINEARQLLFVTNNIMSPAKNKINMGLVYDAITASYLLTGEREIPKPLYLTMLEIVINTLDYRTLKQRLLKHGISEYSGKGTFSLVLPADLTYIHSNLIIMDGVLVSGRVTGEHIGPSSKSLVEQIFIDYGSTRYAEFLTKASYLVLKFITERGHTVGIADCMAIQPEQRQREIRENEKAVEVIQSQIDALPETLEDDETAKKIRENQINNIIRQSDEIGFSTIMEGVKEPGNNIGVMIADIGGGAKGKKFNIKQIRGRLGQQYKKGERLQPSCGGRIIPAYDANDPDIRARGYITSNFMRGLSPEEHFLHMMAAREGLIDTAVNVSIMGDIHRRIVKALENIHIGNNGAVVNSSKANFQLLYGADGFDPSKLVIVRNQTDGSAMPMFIDPFILATKLNVKAGWLPEKALKFSKFRRYVITIPYHINITDNENFVKLKNEVASYIEKFLYKLEDLDSTNKLTSKAERLALTLVNEHFITSTANQNVTESNYRNIREQLSSILYDENAAVDEDIREIVEAAQSKILNKDYTLNLINSKQFLDIEARHVVKYLREDLFQLLKQDELLQTITETDGSFQLYYNVSDPGDTDRSLSEIKQYYEGEVEYQIEFIKQQIKQNSEKFGQLNLERIHLSS